MSADGIVIAALLVPIVASGLVARAQHPSDQRPEQVLRLKIGEGKPNDPGRVFIVPVTCNGVTAGFSFSCFGITVISESFAEKCGAQVVEDEALARRLDPEGNPIYAGSSRIRLRLGNREQTLHVAVIHDRYCQKPEKEGILGFDAIRPFQWEVDPAAPSLTLRPPGTPAHDKPLAVLPLMLRSTGYYVKVIVRNAPGELALMPGSSFVQVGPRLQRAWDLNSGKPLDLEVHRVGNVRTVVFEHQDAIELAPDLKETNLRVALIGDVRHPEEEGVSDNGLGECVLTRFAYCVDPGRRELRIMSRIASESR